MNPLTRNRIRRCLRHACSYWDVVIAFALGAVVARIAWGYLFWLLGWKETP